ncbi:hypothetical protein [Cloacibacterium normanense]|uniref:Methylase-associated X1 domain-containing protein n=1 Tax=Cloacibacterium normanense TaxID=237258 RepID=A0A1E5UDV6_9FLAO|nr:hypothetical protein [Cloacibacterium normanense]AZI69776.1 hypothetical protein EB819_07745 [Cloacibacterium normanense]OEL11101.1 hypothetical protein BHF72_2455 [Cloacibacterium normanense]SDO87475.1 hypothetical protein SAMN04489756_12412 [Cloacibacterium normanense]
MNEYKNIDKIKPEKLLELAREILDKSDDFVYKSGSQPFLMSFKNEDFYVYIKNISSAYFSDRDKTTRAQLPIKKEFEEIKKSAKTFIFLGYDGINDVYVCWNFNVAKSRLNVGKSVSFYSRSFFQSEVKEGEFVKRLLKNGDTPVFFKRTSLIDFFENIHSFFSTEFGTPEFEKIVYRKDSLEDEFLFYLENHRMLSDKSIKNYFGALKGRITNGINNFFLKDLNSIFFIDDILILNRIHHELFKKEEFKELNIIGKNMYSCAFDAYIDFLKFNSLKNIPKNSLLNESPTEYLSEGKLSKITDLDLLQKIEPYLKSNRILTAAQIVGEYYKNQYVKMELKDWIKLVNDCLPK